MALMLVSNNTASVAKGHALREMREGFGLSVRDVSIYTGWTERQIRNWEAGRSPFKRAVIVAYVMAGQTEPPEVSDAIERIDAADDDPMPRHPQGHPGQRPRQDSNLRPSDYRSERLRRVA